MKTLFLILTLIFCSCCPTETKKPQVNKRIKLVEYMTESPYLYIIEVDGKEYLVNYHGGICPHIK
jgi:hypothetical protein